jgi:hypothetical protein
LQQGERQPEQRREFLDALPQLQDFLPEFRLREVRYVRRVMRTIIGHSLTPLNS